MARTRPRSVRPSETRRLVPSERLLQLRREIYPTSIPFRIRFPERYPSPPVTSPFRLFFPTSASRPRPDNTSTEHLSPEDRVYAQVALHTSVRTFLRGELRSIFPSARESTSRPVRTCVLRNALRLALSSGRLYNAVRSELRVLRGLAPELITLIIRTAVRMEVRSFLSRFPTNDPLRTSLPTSE
jgi:hypothetical protein